MEPSPHASLREAPFSAPLAPLTDSRPDLLDHCHSLLTSLPASTPAPFGPSPTWQSSPTRGPRPTSHTCTLSIALAGTCTASLPLGALPMTHVPEKPSLVALPSKADVHTCLHPRICENTWVHKGTGAHPHTSAHYTQVHTHMQVHTCAQIHTG